MKKYLTVLKIGIQEGLEYRSELFIYMMAWSIRFIISIFLFTALTAEKKMLGIYDTKTIITYFLVIQILTALNFAKTGMQVSDDIQSGDFSNYMLKPISYTLYYLVVEFSKNIVRFIVALAIFGVILVVYDRSFFNLALLKNTPFMIISCIIAYCIASLMNMIIGILAFWVVNAKRIIFMYFAVMSIFSGMMIPLSLFPEKIQKIIFMTPMPYTLYVPAQIALNKYNAMETVKMMGIQALFAIGLFLMIQYIYYLGIKKYEAVGR